MFNPNFKIEIFHALCTMRLSPNAYSLVIALRLSLCAKLFALCSLGLSPCA
jgi:hypothetical protein